MDEVPGFFAEVDAELFILIADVQRTHGIAGDLLEIGAWYGRSAILLGYLRDGAHLHVCDLFEQPPPTDSGRRELIEGSVAGVPTRAEFQDTYREFHEELPIVHQCPSDKLADEGLNRTFRFIHIDGSHTFDAVRGDIELAQSIAVDGGVVVVDDFANFAYPSVAAAVWPALQEGRIEPFACTSDKLYAVAGANWAAGYREAVEDYATRNNQRIRHTEIGASLVLSIWPPAERSLAARLTRRLGRAVARRTRRLGRQSPSDARARR